MILQLNPLLDALEIARRAAADAANRDDEVTVDDQPDHWVFEFIPRSDSLGGGSRVTIAKDGCRVVKVIRCQ
jgi:hypothetical protein